MSLQSEEPIHPVPEVFSLVINKNEITFIKFILTPKPTVKTSSYQCFFKGYFIDFFPLEEI